MSAEAERNRAIEERLSALEAQLARQTERLASIQEIALALGSTLDLDRLLDLIMREVTRLMRAERSTLFLCDEERRELWSKIAQGAAVEEIRLAYGEGIAGHVAATGETVNIPDAYADPRFQREWDRRTGFRTRSILCEPIRNNRGQIIGVIQVLNKRDDGIFTPDDETLLAALASPASLSLENSKLYRSVVAKNEELVQTQRRLERKMFELEFLFRIEQELHSAADEDAAIESVIRQACSALGVEGCSVLVERGTELCFQYASGSRGDAIKRFRLAPGEGIAGWVAREGTPVLTNDPVHDPRYRWPIAEALLFPVRSILCVPLTADDRTVGAFELVNKVAGDFTEDDLPLATLVAGIVSKAIQQARHREAMEKADRLVEIGKILSGILHDFKTPMTIISGYAQMAAQDRSPAERQQCCDAILRQLDQMSAMTREILAFARGESTVLLRRVFVNQFFRDIEEALGPEFAARGQSLTVQLRYRGAARFDEGKIRRLVYNIARNAMDAMGAGGAFEIVVDQEGESLTLTFRDTGPGIPEEIRGRVFESFVKGGKSKGTGLGLAIVKKIVDDHGGRIAFETETGRGTTFRVALPLEPPGG